MPKNKNIPASSTKVIDQAKGMLPERISITRGGGRFQLGIQLDDGQGGLVPILIVENEPGAFRHGKTFFVARFETEADFGTKADHDFLSRRFGKVKVRKPILPPMS